MLTIPYDKGWQIRLNGEKVEAQPVFGVFTGIPLSTGKHSLEFQYIPEGLLPGCVLSLCTFCFILWDERRGKRKNRG